ncbi:hypothetical protein ACQKWADRAFT_319317 [Trichoderma austrokoningii]
MIRQSSRLIRHIPHSIPSRLGRSSSARQSIPEASRTIRQDAAKETLLKKMGESAATTFASIFVLAFGFAAAGYIYHKSYKMIVLKKLTRAFEPGDPVLDLATTAKEVPRRVVEEEHWVQRPEQEYVDAIIDGRESGHYYLFMGEKGTGKSSMLIEAMRKTDGDGVAMFEAHADTEIVRIRLGKALDYEFHEDYIGGYFSERGPRETTALLDIERALNKMEKVAMKLRNKRGKPLVLIVNQLHLLRNNDEGRDLIELLQQRAEQWAAASLVTMIFNTDDYWVYERLKLLATRMDVLAVTDLPKSQAINALKKYRVRYFKEIPSHQELEDVYDRIGGRLSFLNRVAKSRDMINTCEKIKETEKKWFLNQCWILGSEMDDDVMDQQKWAAAAMVLALALVDKEEEMDKTYDPVVGHMLPTFPFHIAQELMTRADFIRDLDSLNLFTVTSQADVRASSVPMHLAFKEICSEPRFRKHLEDTIQRISDIESLGRTRELVAKDLVLGGEYDIQTSRKGITHGDASLSPPSTAGLMSVNAKWPDFQLASKLRYFMGSKAESHTPAAAMAEIDNEPIEEMAGVDDYEHEGDDTGVDIDFGDLEMFDSNASQLPFLTQESQGPESEEPVFPTSSESTKRDKTKKKKKKKKSLGETAEVAGDQPTEAVLDAPNGLEDATTDMDALDLTPVPSTQKKKKRKTADSADGKRHKKRKGLEDGDTTASQQTQDETEDTGARNTAMSFLYADKNASSQPLDLVDEVDQMSPSIALARRRSHTGEETRSRENSVSRTRVAPMAPMAPMAVDTSTQESAPEDASKNQEAAIEDHKEDRDVEDLAREAWREHVNSQSGNASATSKVEPASQDPASQDPAQAEEQLDATPRRRSARTKKPKPSSLALEVAETPAKRNRRALEELPSPSANTPKPRARSTRATKKPRKGAEKNSEDNLEDEEFNKPVRRANKLENYTQGRFTDAEFDGINRAIEAFRSEYGLTQVQINEMIQAPGGTTAGSDHSRLWHRLFEACPDRKRQKVINVARKKFHNFVGRGKWTPEQDAELSALINVNGTAWSRIAGIINRHPEDVRDRYRNYIVCGANQRRDVWTEDEEARLKEYVNEATEAIDELRKEAPQTVLLQKAYEELIDWQNISEKMERTRSRLQCITKWKAMQNRISGKKKEKKNPEDKKSKRPTQSEIVISDEDISSQLDQARQQMMSMREEDQYRLVLAIQGASVLSDDQIPWAKLLDKKFRNQWSRGTQILLWDRLKQTVPDWETASVLDVAQYIINEYNRTGSLPEVTGSGYDDDEREKELLGHSHSRSKPTAVAKSAEFVVDSGAEDENHDKDGKPDITIDPALMEDPPLSPPKTTPKPKKTTQRKPRAKKSKKLSLSQDPIEESEPVLPPATLDEGEESNLDEAQLRKSKTPSKFKSVNTALEEENGVAASQGGEPYSDSIMDDMEDLPARVLA